MPAAALTGLLACYREQHPGEAALAARFVEFVAAHDDCLWRSCLVGHITASCWIVDAAMGSALLLHHRKLDRWLQPGGHVDGDGELQRAALREAREETGIDAFELATLEGRLMPLDLDVHRIPARGAEPEHDHWDVRFLLRALPDQPLRGSDESNDLRWVPFAELPQWTQEESVLRMLRKARRWLGRCRWLPV